MKLKQGESKFEILSHHGLGDIYFDHSTQQRSFVATRDITAGEILYQFNPKQMQSNPKTVETKRPSKASTLPSFVKLHNKIYS